MRRSHRFWRVLGASAVGLAGWVLRDVPKQLGARSSGTRAQRIRRSAQFVGGKFRNPVATVLLRDGALSGALRGQRLWGQQRSPRRPIPVRAPDFGHDLRAESLHVTWMGHASALVEIEGMTVLFDPVWSDRCSPVTFAGPRRLHRPPIGLHELPAIDAVVISHDHYDHLDMPTIMTLAETQKAVFVVPLGVGAHLERWDVSAERIVELDWEETTDVIAAAGDDRMITLTATGARHFSGRGLTRYDTLWASWVMKGRTRSVFYTGDSGYWDGYTSIGESHGPFDVSMVQMGAYNDAWPDVHMTPEEGVAAHLDVKARTLLPVHWCTFDLAPHDWAEPVERLCEAARAQDVILAVPRPGQRIDVDALPALEQWWRDVA